MFKRRFKWFGKLVNDEGCSLKYKHRSVEYTDKRGTFEFPFEDGFLFPRPHQVSGHKVLLNQSEIEEMIEQVITAIKSEGNEVQLYEKD